MLSHEDATEHDFDFQHVVRPLAPLVVYGRFARKDPPCHKQECVYYLWRDRRCYEMGSDRRHFVDVRGSHSTLALGHVSALSFFCRPARVRRIICCARLGAMLESLSPQLVISVRVCARR